MTSSSSMECDLKFNVTALLQKEYHESTFSIDKFLNDLQSHLESKPKGHHLQIKCTSEGFVFKKHNKFCKGAYHDFIPTKNVSQFATVDNMRELFILVIKSDRYGYYYSEAYRCTKAKHVDNIKSYLEEVTHSTSSNEQESIINKPNSLASSGWSSVEEVVQTVMDQPEAVIERNEQVVVDGKEEDELEEEEEEEERKMIFSPHLFSASQEFHSDDEPTEKNEVFKLNSCKNNPFYEDMKNDHGLEDDMTCFMYHPRKGYVINATGPIYMTFQRHESNKMFDTE